MQLSPQGAGHFYNSNHNFSTTCSVGEGSSPRLLAHRSWSKKNKMAGITKSSKAVHWSFLLTRSEKNVFSDFFHCSKRSKWCVCVCVVFCSPWFLSVFIQHLSWIFLRIFDFISIPVGPSVGQKPSIYYGRKSIRIVAPKCKSLIISPKFWGVSFLLLSFARRKRGGFLHSFMVGPIICEINMWKS